MKIALIGATGFTGAKILAEALARGHAVTAIVRDAAKLPAHPLLNAVAADAADAAQLARAAAGHDLAISAFNPAGDGDGSATLAIIDGVKRAGVARLLVVGGAGSLAHPAGGRVVDQPDFPVEWKAAAERTARFLDQLRDEKELDWVFLSPAAMLVPGARTGRYRTGDDDLLVDAEGASRISLEDYACAMLDEAERPQRHRARFTVAW